MVEKQSRTIRCRRAHLEALLTDYLIVGEAHYVHGLHCLLEVVLVLLARDGEVPVGQEAVVVKAFKKQVS